MTPLLRHAGWRSPGLLQCVRSSVVTLTDALWMGNCILCVGIGMLNMARHMTYRRFVVGQVYSGTSLADRYNISHVSSNRTSTRAIRDQDAMCTYYCHFA